MGIRDWELKDNVVCVVLKYVYRYTIKMKGFSG